MRPQRVEPGPGQESVWDYPRPPRLERTTDHIVVVLGGETIADTTAAFRVLETSHPPTYYLPPADFTPGALVPTTGSSFCEWKGMASYADVVGGGRTAPKAAWWYDHPTPGWEALTGHVALYAASMDACYVDGEQVEPQPGGFYGGWVTSKVVGPFKGSPGTMGW